MKNTKLFLFSLSNLSLLVPAMAIAGPGLDELTKFTINTSSYGPFEYGQIDKEVVINYSCNKSLYLQERFLFGNNINNYTTSYSQPAHNLVKNNTYSISFNFPTSKYLSNSGMFCSFRIIDPNNLNILYKIDFTIYPISHEILNVDNYRLNNFVSKNIGFKITNSVFEYLYDELNFADYKNYADVNNYYQFLLSNFYFYYKGKSSQLGSSFLMFDDKYNLFPNLNRDKNFVNIGLKLLKNNDNLNFKFQKTLYVNPKNLDLSSNYIDGYKMTSNFYLPVNKLDNIRKYVFYINVSDFGYNKLSFINAITFDVTNYYVGNCNNADICVVGGIEQ